MHFITCYTHASHHQKNIPTSLFYISFSRQVLYVIIIPTLRLLWRLCCNCSSSVPIVQRFFGFSGSYPEVLWLLCQSQFFIFSGSYSQSFFWLLWLLSPFLHVTTGGDHTPIQKVLHDLGLASASSPFFFI
jgi:hypothetical protein